MEWVVLERKNPCNLLSSQGFFSIGGEGGIRTHGTARFNGFQDRRFRPLSHLSEFCNQILSGFCDIFVTLFVTELFSEGRNCTRPVTYRLALHLANGRQPQPLLAARAAWRARRYPA